jgi:ribosome-associated toxin RatA of RatAB toxin-antitoxin module
MPVRSSILVVAWLLAAAGSVRAEVVHARTSEAPTASIPPPTAPLHPPLASAPQIAPPPTFDAAARATLLEGEALAELVEDEGGHSGAVRGWILCRCAKEAVWKVITHHVHFPEFLPRVKEVQISRRTNFGERAAQLVDATVTELRYTLDYVWDPATGRVDFHMVDDEPHDVVSVRGHWQLWPFEGGATLIEYQTALDAGRTVPGFIRSYLARRAALDTLEAVVRRSEKQKT